MIQIWNNETSWPTEGHFFQISACAPAEVLCVYGMIHVLSVADRRCHVSFCCRASRLFWSTIDPRRRTVYTLKVTEVHPKVVHAPTVVMNDITVAHDESDPRYDAALAAKYGSAAQMVPEQGTSDTLSEASTVSATETDDVETARRSVSEVFRHEKAANFVAKQLLTRGHWSQHRPDALMSRSLDSMSAAPRRPPLGRSTSLTTDGSGQSCAMTTPTVSRLSASTLKLLGMSSHNGSASVAAGGDNQHTGVVVADSLSHDELLLTMAKRLNDAAARSSRNTAMTDGTEAAQRRMSDSIETGSPWAEQTATEMGLHRSMQTDGPPYHDTDDDDESEYVTCNDVSDSIADSGGDDVVQECRPAASDSCGGKLSQNGNQRGSSADIVSQESVHDTATSQNKRHFDDSSKPLEQSSGAAEFQNFSVTTARSSSRRKRRIPFVILCDVVKSGFAEISHNGICRLSRQTICSECMLKQSVSSLRGFAELLRDDEADQNVSLVSNTTAACTSSAIASSVYTTASVCSSSSLPPPSLADKSAATATTVSSAVEPPAATSDSLCAGTEAIATTATTLSPSVSAISADKTSSLNLSAEMAASIASEVESPAVSDSSCLATEAVATTAASPLVLELSSSDSSSSVEEIYATASNTSLPQVESTAVSHSLCTATAEISAITASPSVSASTSAEQLLSMSTANSYTASEVECDKSGVTDTAVLHTGIDLLQSSPSRDGVSAANENETSFGKPDEISELPSLSPARSAQSASEADGDRLSTEDVVSESGETDNMSDYSISVDALRPVSSSASLSYMSVDDNEHKNDDSDDYVTSVADTAVLKTGVTLPQFSANPDLISTETESETVSSKAGEIYTSAGPVAASTEGQPVASEPFASAVHDDGISTESESETTLSSKPGEISLPAELLSSSSELVVSEPVTLAIPSSSESVIAVSEHVTLSSNESQLIVSEPIMLTISSSSEHEVVESGPDSFTDDEDLTYYGIQSASDGNIESSDVPSVDGDVGTDIQASVPPSQSAVSAPVSSEGDSVCIPGNVEASAEESVVDDVETDDQAQIQPSQNTTSAPVSSDDDSVCIPGSVKASAEVSDNVEALVEASVVDDVGTDVQDQIPPSQNATSAPVSSDDDSDRIPTNVKASAEVSDSVEALVEASVLDDGEMDIQASSTSSQSVASAAVSSIQAPVSLLNEMTTVSAASVTDNAVGVDVQALLPPLQTAASTSVLAPTAVSHLSELSSKSSVIVISTSSTPSIIQSSSRSHTTISHPSVLSSKSSATSASSPVSLSAAQSVSATVGGPLPCPSTFTAASSSVPIVLSSQSVSADVGSAVSQSPTCPVSFLRQLLATAKHSRPYFIHVMPRTLPATAAAGLTASTSLPLDTLPAQPVGVNHGSKLNSQLSVINVLERPHIPSSYVQPTTVSAQRLQPESTTSATSKRSLVSEDEPAAKRICASNSADTIPILRNEMHQVTSSRSDHQGSSLIGLRDTTANESGYRLARATANVCDSWARARTASDQPFYRPGALHISQPVSQPTAQPKDLQITLQPSVHATGGLISPESQPSDRPPMQHTTQAGDYRITLQSGTQPAVLADRSNCPTTMPTRGRRGHRQSSVTSRTTHTGR